MIRYFGSAGILLLIATAAGAQSSVNATTSAVVVSPATIKSRYEERTNVIRPISISLAELSSGTEHERAARQHSRARSLVVADVTVSCEPEYTYSVSVTSQAMIISDRGNSLSVDLYLERAGQMSDEGSGLHGQRFQLNAMLKETALQRPGAYTSTTPAVVTVNYN